MHKLNEIETQLAGLIVDTLNLEMSPGQIDPEAPLFGEGLGLDSIDMLEISILISEQYGIAFTTETVDVMVVFASLRSLAAYIAQHRNG